MECAGSALGVFTDRDSGDCDRIWGRMLALGQRDGLVKLVDVATREEKWGVQAHAGSSRTAVAISPNGSCVASVGLSDRHWKL